MSEAERARISRALQPRLTKYTKIGLKNKRQIVFLLLLDVMEVLFGGAAGGGKSVGLLAAASQFVDVPGYAALLLRRRYRDLALPGALMAISKQWWLGTDAKWSEQAGKWTFPSGAEIQFGYLEHDGDEQQYQSAAFQYVGFDELTQFSETQYTYLFSRLRRPDDVERFPALRSVPLRMRAASNPGNKGHSWVKKRWGIRMYKGEAIGANTRDRVFIQSKLPDNPYLDQESYEKSLEMLSDVTRQQLRLGDWSAVASGGVFDPSAITVVPDLPDRRHWTGLVRHWDLAASEPTEDEPDPDYTVGLKLLRVSMPPPSVVEMATRKFLELPPPPYWIVLDIVRAQKEGRGVEKMVYDAARKDGFQVPISIEQERGATGLLIISSYRENVVPGYKVHKLRSEGNKLARAHLVSPMVNKGRVYCLEGSWVEAFLDELGIFTGDDKIHDDQVDGLTGAFIQIDRLARIADNDDQVKQYGAAFASPRG